MFSNAKQLLTAKKLREEGFGSAMVSGGPFKTGQTMDHQIVDVSNNVVGVLTVDGARLVNRLAELHRLLVDMDAAQHLKQRFDFGYLDIPVDMLLRLETLLAPE
jgi:hypothetical protein